jgi:signal transduction histidine kinase/ribosomal protein L37E
MSEKTACRRCGQTGPADALYCAHCGYALIPLRTRLSNTTNRLLDKLSRCHIGWLSLVALVPIGLLANHLLVRTGLYFPSSLVLLALSLGVGSGYWGWQWDAPSSNRHRLRRTLLVFAGTMLSLAAIWQIDRALLSSLAGTDRRIVSDIPGVHLEASGGYKRLHISNAPPYWLFVMLYALLVAAAGHLARKRYARLTIREREVRTLRESLLARTHDAAIQQERHRLARELHDSIKQQIFSIGMSAAAAKARWDTDPQGAQDALDDVRRNAQEAMIEMNALLQQLSPTPLEKVGLVQALRDQCEALGYRTDAEVTVEFGELPDDDRLPTGAQESIFRIAQETFSNIARHARADHVRLYLGHRPVEANAPAGRRDADGPLTLEIQDDGQGFEVDAVAGGMGLENIRQRVRALGGKLAIESAPGKGTTLCVTVPLTEPIFFQEETMPNHTLNKIFLAGLGGGLALIGALFYPLYVLVPSRYIEGWPVGSEMLGLTLESVAALLAVATGFLATRWAKAGTRQVGTLFGALAGGAAGAVLCLGIGGAAAGLTGSADLLGRGLVVAGSDVDATLLAIRSAAGIVGWSHGTFWATLLAGTGLGALGGLLSPPEAETPAPTDWRHAATIILSTGALASTFTLLIATPLFPLLESFIHDSFVEGVPSLAGVSLWPISTAAIFCLASLVAMYRLLRGEVETEDPTRLYVLQAQAAFFGLIAFSVPAYILIVGSSVIRLITLALGGVIAIVVSGSLLLGSLYLVTFVKVRRRRQALGLVRPQPMRTAAAVGALLSLGAILWAITLSPFFSLLVGLIVVVADVALLMILRRQPSSDTAVLARGRLTMVQQINASMGSVFAMLVPPMAIINTLISIKSLSDFDALHHTVAEFVRNLYLNQARVCLAMFVVAAVGLGYGLLTSAIGGIIAKQRPIQNVRTA